MRENTDQNNSEYGHFSRSDWYHYIFGFSSSYLSLVLENLCSVQGADKGRMNNQIESMNLDVNSFELHQECGEIGGEGSHAKSL